MIESLSINDCQYVNLAVKKDIVRVLIIALQTETCSFAVVGENGAEGDRKASKSSCWPTVNSRRALSVSSKDTVDNPDSMRTGSQKQGRCPLAPERVSMGLVQKRAIRTVNSGPEYGHGDARLQGGACQSLVQ